MPTVTIDHDPVFLELDHNNEYEVQVRALVGDVTSAWADSKFATPLPPTSSAVISGQSDLSVSVFVDAHEEFQISILAALDTTVLVGMRAATDADATATLLATGTIAVPVAVDLGATSELVVHAQKEFLADVSMAASSSLSASARTGVIITKYATSSMDVSAVVDHRTNNVYTLGQALVETDLHLEAFRAVAIDAEAQASATGTIEYVANAALAASTDLDVSVFAEAFNSTQMIAESYIDTSYFVEALPTLHLEATATSAIVGFADRFTSATFAGEALTLATPFVTVFVDAEAPATASMDTVEFLEAYTGLSLSGYATATFIEVVEYVTSASLAATTDMSADYFVDVTFLVDIEALALVDAHALDPFPYPPELIVSRTPQGGIFLDWSPTPQATAYDVERAGIIIARTTQSEYHDTDVTPETKYTYRVRSVLENA